MVAPGCYSAHRGHDPDAAVSDDASDDAADRRDTGPTCAEPGTYDTPYRVESATPESCADLFPAILPIVFPLEDHFVVDPRTTSLTLTSVGPCQWAFEYVEDSPFPGNGFRSSGVLGIGADGFFGRVESSWSADPGGGCDTVVILGSGVPGP